MMDTGRPESDAMATEIHRALAECHLASLRQGSGISDPVIEARGYRTISDARELAALGFTPVQRRTPGLLLPLWTVDGQNALQVYRPDVPRQRRDKSGVPKVIKYEMPAGCGVRLDCPPLCRPMLANPAVPLWITEGQKKADALASPGLCAIALLGVWNFKGRNEFGGTTILADFDHIAFEGREVSIVFDSDLMTKPEVRQALDRLREILQRKKAHVTAVYLPGGPDGKVGVDDWLVAGHTVSELEALAEAPRPQPCAAQPIVELIDEAPSTLRRPLDLIDGRAYAGIWPHVRVTRTESDSNTGDIVRHDPPLVTTERRALIVRDDGVIFGAGGDRPLEDLDIEVHLEESPRQERLWRAPAVKRYRAGNRPDVASVVDRLVSVFNHFIDFSRSLGTQIEMCRLSACFSLSTWCLPAFTVIGYPWPHGEKGSGKTQWGICWAGTSYLGEVIMASGSFAALRDLADYGATLLFDDAENISDPKRTDPDKRALLLAGNRKGTQIPLKALVNERWQTRWVNAFCPRGFTAISLPDPVLASRVVIIPLVRTADPTRGNADPADFERWPCDQAQLQDDLWALALSLLPEAKGIWTELEAERESFGRLFEPWRAMLAVARLMDRHGVEGLEASIRRVMHASHAERGTLTENDRPALVIRAVLALARARGGDACDTCDTHDALAERVTFTAKDVAEAIHQLAEASETMNVEWATPMRVGHVLSNLRFAKDRTGKARTREISITDLLGLAQAHGVTVDEDLLAPLILKASQPSQVSQVSPDGPDCPTDDGTGCPLRTPDCEVIEV